ncbi:class I SAM-dependent methyltransferase [bacterium]|nr:class I SAM-dependent methyltransferase [bacterium]
MERSEYKTLYDFEDSYWWYLGQKHTILKLLTTYVGLDKIKEFKILDAGCGTGGNLQLLEDFTKSFGFDYSQVALTFCKKRGQRFLCRGSVVEPPFKPESFDFILSMDVLCNKTIKDKFMVVKNIRDLLKPGGYLLINLPAFHSLMGEHDLAVHTDKRFSMSETKQMLKEADLDIVRIIYFNTLLFPIIGLTRLLNKMKTKNKEVYSSDFKKLPPIINSLLFNLLKFEASYMKYFNIPFGLSIMALAQKDPHKTIINITERKK